MIAEQGVAAPVDVWVGLGANLGEREEALRSALQRMAEWPDTRLIAVSALYSSAPVDAGGPDYLNAHGAAPSHERTRICAAAAGRSGAWLGEPSCAGCRGRPAHCPLTPGMGCRFAIKI